MLRLLGKFFARMERMDPDRDGMIDPVMPRCPLCGNRQFLFLTDPTFTTDRFGRRRIKSMVRCSNCFLKVSALRDLATSANRWTFDLPA